MNPPFLTHMDAELLKHLEDLKARQLEIHKLLGKLERDIPGLKKGMEWVIDRISGRRDGILFSLVLENHPKKWNSSSGSCPERERSLYRAANYGPKGEYP